MPCASFRILINRCSQKTNQGISSAPVLSFRGFTPTYSMTIRQSVIKIFYPVLMSIGRWFSAKKNYLENSGNIQPVETLFDLSFSTLLQDELTLKQFKGKKILLVNTASDCGFTPQLEELQQLQEQYKDKVVVIGFPSNDFKEQEKGSDAEISTFCKVNYGVQFLLASKTVVTQSPQQHPIFQWLTNKDKNGWNQQPPAWNFTKYLVNEEGMLTYVFASSISPLSIKLTSIL